MRKKIHYYVELVESGTPDEGAAAMATAMRIYNDFLLRLATERISAEDNEIPKDDSLGRFINEGGALHQSLHGRPSRARVLSG